MSKSKAYEMADAGDLRTHLDEHRRRRVKPADLAPLLAVQNDQQDDLFASDEPYRDRWLAALLESEAPDGAKALGRFLHAHMDAETGEVEPDVVALLESIRQGDDQ